MELNINKEIRCQIEEMVVIMDVDVIFFRRMQEKSFVIQMRVVELSKAALEIMF